MENSSNIPRCGWVKLGNPQYVKYHDEEWGIPVHDDRVHFEFLVLESAQAGLSWETVLKRRDYYRKAFANYNPKIVSGFGEEKIAELMANPGLIRNNLKIRAAINNAKVFISIQKEFGSFDAFLWKFSDNKVVVNHPLTMRQIPVSSPLSDAVSKELKKRGMSFVGTTIIYAHLQAVGVVNDHTMECFRKK